jgi:hypothetical protein
MAKKSSVMLALLFIANPFVLLFYQNCSSAPKHVVSVPEHQGDKKPASERPVIGPKEKYTK